MAFAAASPTRRPVNDPGPRPTAIACTSVKSPSAAGRTSPALSGGSWADSQTTRSSSISAQAVVGVDVSSARIFTACAARADPRVGSLAECSDPAPCGRLQRGESLSPRAPQLCGAFRALFEPLADRVVAEG